MPSLGSPWMPGHLGAGVGQETKVAASGQALGAKWDSSSRGEPDSRHSPGLLVGAHCICRGYSLPGVTWGPGSSRDLDGTAPFSLPASPAS